MTHSGDAGNPHTAAIASFVSGLRYERIPADVIARIKLLVLDSLGCAIYGADLAWSRILRETLAEVDEATSASVWGTSHRLSSPHAVLVNGALVQSFELDDVHRVGVLHVGAVTLPPIFAILERDPSINGRDFLAATVAGYEIGPRVGICMGQEHIGQGWHSGATLGVFSAASGAAAALRLDAAQTVNAIGIAGTQSAGLMAAQYGAMVKRMHAGRSAQSGYYGAILARRGYTGIQNVFESEYGGFCSTFSRSHDRYDLAALSDGLGERFETLQIALKFYSCVGSNHTTLDGIRDINARRPFVVDEVEKIIIHGSKVTIDHVGWAYKPEGLTSAQLNLPYCVATFLLEGDAFVAQFTEDKVADPARMAFSRRVEVVEDPQITALGSRYRHKVRVEVRLRNGEVHEQTVEAPRGSEKRFASDQDVINKFRKLAETRLANPQIDRVVNLVMDAERMASARELAAALSA
ncbi:MAG TPA: MmgE/PrpD family protein [Xanthobacteraceae bacterium]